MAIDWDGSPNGVFTRFGKLIKNSDLLETFTVTTLETYRDEVNDAFYGTTGSVQEGARRSIEGFDGFMDGMQQGILSYRRSMSGFGDRVWLDDINILPELNLPANAPLSTVLDGVVKQLVTDGETVNQSVVTVPASSNPDTGASGNGVLLMDKVLDGVTPPAIDHRPQLSYLDWDSELAYNETMVFECTSDSQGSGTAEGAELFTWRGDTLKRNLDHVDPGGSGVIGSIPVLNAYEYVSNRSFETWVNTNTPISWDIDSGVPGTDIIQETALAEVYRGLAALRFDGNAKIYQTQLVTRLRPNKRYCLAAWIKGSGTGDLTIQFESPNTGLYVPAASEKIEISGAFNASYTLYHFYLTMPSEIPFDLRLTVESANWNAEVWVDSIAFGEVSYGGGVSAVLVAGSSRFVQGDQFTVSVTNDEAGTIQSYFRNKYNLQLPSSGTPTILDSLAE